MDTLPLTAESLARFFHIKGSEVERYYKHHLSDFETWPQKGHAADWVLPDKNLGTSCGIDETSLCNEVYTILSNKAGHGKKRSVVAVVKGTKVQAVSAVLKKIPESERAKVTEITMDFSDSMFGIAKECFPNATVVIDCFHIVQRLCEGVEEMRLKFKRLAASETQKETAAFARNEDRKAKQRAYYRRRHPKNKNERRGAQTHTQAEVHADAACQWRDQSGNADTFPEHACAVRRQMGRKQAGESQSFIRAVPADKRGILAHLQSACNLQDENNA